MGLFDEIEEILNGASENGENGEEKAAGAPTEASSATEGTGAAEAGCAPAGAGDDGGEKTGASCEAAGAGVPSPGGPAGQPSFQEGAGEPVQTNLFGEPVSGCGAGTKKKPKGVSKSGSSEKPAVKVQAPPKEPDKDLERLVVITLHNERRTYPAEMSLEEIRADLEKDYPAFSKENTTWYFEKQEQNNRYLCIPSYKFNKAG